MIHIPDEKHLRLQQELRNAITLDNKDMAYAILDVIADITQQHCPACGKSTDEIMDWAFDHLPAAKGCQCAVLGEHNGVCDACLDQAWEYTTQHIKNAGACVKCELYEELTIRPEDT